MIILGIDPGYATIGFAIIEKNIQQLHVLEYGVITTEKNDVFGNRLCQLAEDFENIIMSYTPDLIAMEKLFWGNNVDNAIKVAEARGVLEYIIAKKNIPLMEYAPTEIKSRLVGHGKAPKFQLQNILKLRLRLDSIPTPDDAADAIAIALVCAQEHR